MGSKGFLYNAGNLEVSIGGEVGDDSRTLPFAFFAVNIFVMNVGYILVMVGDALSVES